MSATSTASRDYTLHALRFEDVRATPEQLVERLNTTRARYIDAPAVLSVTSYEVPDPRRNAEPGETVLEVAVVLDGNVLRNTEAHGIASRYGFVAHTQSYAAAVA